MLSVAKWRVLGGVTPVNALFPVDDDVDDAGRVMPEFERVQDSDESSRPRCCWPVDNERSIWVMGEDPCCCCLKCGSTVEGEKHCTVKYGVIRRSAVAVAGVGEYADRQLGLFLSFLPARGSSAGREGGWLT